MFSRDQFNKMLFFDIETATKYSSYSEFLAADPDGAHIYEKKSDRLKFESPDWAYINKAAVHPEFSRVVCLSFGMWENGQMKIKTLYEENEKDLINKIANLFHTAASRGYTPVGWNIKNFDLPWLYRKMLIYGIQIPTLINTFGVKPWELKSTDLKELWKGGSNLDVTFEEACYSMGIVNPKNTLGGDKVHSAWHDGEIDQIKKYCEEDVRAMIDMVQKIYNSYNPNDLTNYA